MDKKQADRRPAEKPAEHGSGTFDPNRPEPGRRMPEAPEGNKGFGKPEGQPIDKQMPTPEMRAGRKTSSRASGATGSRADPCSSTRMRTTSES